MILYPSWFGLDRSISSGIGTYTPRQIVACLSGDKVVDGSKVRRYGFLSAAVLGLFCVQRIVISG